MKITGIKFLNLNSLKGEHEIRFDRAPFTESGIFAITGPTGAGKTTILDAITVALYGRVHRHTKDVFEIMTRHTAESYSEVEFEIGQKSYRAKWSIRRSRGKADGQLQAQKMELSDLPDGNLMISHPLNDVKEEIVRLCGLDYNQFLRSVILSQGDFTRFLKADENERSELLEKITDTGIYSKISVAAYEKAREERIVLDQLKNKLEHVILLSDEEREACYLELKELLARELELKGEETALRDQISWLNHLEKLALRKQELELKLAEDEQYYASHESRFVQLQKHLNALVHRPALAELQTIGKQQIQIEADLRQAETAYPQLVQEEALTKTALTTATEQISAIEKMLAELEPVLETVLKKDILISQSGSQLRLTEQSLEQAKSALHHAEESDQVLEKLLQQIQQRIAELTVWINTRTADADLDKEVLVFKQLLEQFKNSQEREAVLQQRILENRQQAEKEQAARKEASANVISSEKKLAAAGTAILQLKESRQVLVAEKTEEQLQLELREIPVLINTAEQQLKLANQYHKSAGEQSTLLQHITNQTREEQTLSIQFLALQTKYEQANTALADLQQIYELEVKVQKYEADRSALQPQQPCPLCGSVHHPFVEGKYSGRLTESAERRNQQQLKVNSIKQTIDSLSIQLNTLVLHLETGNKTAEVLQESLSQILSEFEQNNQRLPKPLDIHKPGIITAVINRKKEQQESLGQQLTAVKNTIIQIAALEEELALEKEKLNKEKNKSEQAGLTSGFAEKQITLLSAETEAIVQDRKILLHRISAIPAASGFRFDPADPDQTTLKMMESFQRYKQSELELGQLQLDLRQKETEQKNSKITITEKKTAVVKLELQQQTESGQLLQLQTERFALFGDKDPVLERGKLTAEQKTQKVRIDEFQQSLQEKQRKVSVAEDRQKQLNTSFLSTKQLFTLHLEQLTAKLHEEGLDSVNALNQLFLTDEEADTAGKLQKEATQRIASGKSMLAATEKDVETEAGKALTTAAKEILEPELEEKSKTLSLLQQEKGKLNQIITEDDQLKIRHLEVAQQIALQQQQFNRFQELSALIGSADGKKFSRFAQGLTLARLTELANRHLLRLSERYSILKSPEKDLDLQITDHYQADVVRPMSTLSGGESFLVSLALALGLSDLASRKVQINSLFIDEGFGTLDADTLDTAITALENLQASGKNIGIISHVEALKDRIGTQIQLSREPGGTSKIALFNYGARI